MPTFSFFCLLFWDNSQALPEDKQAFIIKHEMAHIRQWHSADALLLELLKVVCWFNPVVYLYKKALEEVHEYLADATVVRQYDARQYSQVMAEQVFRSMNFAFTQSFNRSLITKRIAMLQIHKHHKPALWKMALSLPLIAVLFFVYSCRTGEIVPSQAAKSSANDMYRMGEVVVVGYGTTAIIKNANEKFNKYNLPVPLNTLEEDIYLHVDKAPSPVNGMTDFQKYIQEFVQAGATGKTGTVHVQATINATGNLLNPVVLHGIDAEHDALVLQALQKSNEWNPGKIDGKPVNTRIVIPVPFGKTSTPYTPLSGLKELSKEPTVGKPLPQEGMEAFYKYVQKNLNTLLKPEAT
jgi:hypothetical protein